MGNCGSSLNCTVSEEPVASDPDVAGIGVLVSFITTAALTFIAIIVGYLSDSLPDAVLSPLDRAILAEVSKITWRPWPRKGPLRVSMQRSMSTLLAWAGVSPVFDADQVRDPDKMRLRNRERRSRSLERFVLALSDQQLVTGLAVLIAGYINRCTMSLYHFNIVSALAWFSSTTHLSTLAVLRVYLIDHPRVRDWRVAAMLGILGPLSLAQFGALYTSRNNSSPVQCVLKFAWPTPLNPLGITQIFFIIMFLFSSYGTRIGRLYSSDPDWSVQDWVLEFLVRMMPRKSRKNTRAPHLERIIIASSKRLKSEQIVAFRKVRQRRRLFEQAKLMETRGIFKGRREYLQFMFLSRELSIAFLDDLLILLYGVTFGITQTIVYRRSVPAAGLSGSQNSMGFGQLVPLILMILPAFAAGEVYFGKIFSELLNRRRSNEAQYIERHDYATSEPLHEPAPWMTTTHNTALPTDEDNLPVSHDQNPPVQQPAGTGSNSTMGMDLPQCDIPTTTFHITNTIRMDHLSAIGQTSTSGVTTANTNITPIGRTDTESGLRFTQAGGTSSLREVQASGSGDLSDSDAGAKENVANAPHRWASVVVLLTIFAICRVLFAISLGGAAGLVGFMIVVILSLAMVTLTASSVVYQVSNNVR